MFIETLEFTIPMDLCDLFSTLKRGPRSNLEFPASVNSYGTTQDANIQVVVRSNKLTFKVDGVSSDASMISKSECKTLKLSVFDVDRTLMPSEEENYETDLSSMQYSPQIPTNVSGAKRLLEQSVSLPPAKSSRTSYSESPRPRSPPHRRSHQQPSPRPSQNSDSHSKSHNDTPVNVKQEPEDPDLIEIEPDDIVPKKETPYMQIDYSSDVPHTQTSQAALERLSHPQSSHSQSPASSSSSFHQNVPHVQDYSEPGPSQSHHGDQSADDFLVFQDEDGDENEADYSNDDAKSLDNIGQHMSSSVSSQIYHKSSGNMPHQNLRQLLESFTPGLGRMNTGTGHASSQENLQKFDQSFLPEGARIRQSLLPRSHRGRRIGQYKCQQCGQTFSSQPTLTFHKKAIHDKVVSVCVCGKTYKYRPSLFRHRRDCMAYKLHQT